MSSAPRGLRATVRETAEGAVLEIALDGAAHHVHLRGDGLGCDSADAAVPALLLPAMTTGRFVVDGEVSARLLGALPQVQDVLAAWGPLWEVPARPVPVEARPVARAGADGRGVASFFSGGVDSFHALATHREELDAIVFVHGFDIELADEALRDRAGTTARAVADDLGVELVEVETDLRAFADPRVAWEPYHGGALAAVALLLQHRFHTVLVPATHTYADLFPWGSHPLLDPLWSTERTALVHTGAEATRVEKVGALVDWDVAMSRLRVCWRSPGGYNCGHCEKCLRTMINLAAHGALERCATLPHELDAEAVANMELRGENDLAFARENRVALEARGDAPALVAALARAEAASRRRSDGTEPGTSAERLLAGAYGRAAAAEVRAEAAVRRAAEAEAAAADAERRLAEARAGAGPLPPGRPRRRVQGLVGRVRRRS